MSVEECERAAESVMMLAQEEAFSQEMKVLQRGKSLQNSSPLFRLDPILEGGALRVGGRLDQSSLSLEVRSKSVAKLIHRCVKYRRLRRPAEEQRMAELPKEHVEVSTPFTTSIGSAHSSLRKPAKSKSAMA